MYVPDGLSDFDELIYRTGRIARSEVLLQYANEQLYFELVGRSSRAVNALSKKSHDGFIMANARMVANSSDFDHDLKVIASALFKRAKAAIALRDQVIHGVFVLLEEKGSMIRVNSTPGVRLHWDYEGFDAAHDALRRARKSTGALEDIVAGKDSKSLRLIANDTFALYGDNSAMASTQRGRRTDPETDANPS